MNGIINLFAVPVTYIFKGLNFIFGNNFALLMLLLTIAINVLMLPLTIKSQRSTAKQQMLKPKLDALKKKYGDNMTQQDKMKYQQEMQELYQKENVSMAGGCLPMLIRLPFLFAVYGVIQAPEKYIKGTTFDFNLFGLDLTKWPKFTFDFSELFDGTVDAALWIIPFFAFASQMLTSIVQMRMQKKMNPDQPTMAGMMLTMPLISLFLGFSVPAAVGLYWAFSSLVAGGIQMIVQYVYSPNRIVAENHAKLIIQRNREENERKKSNPTT